MHYVIGDVHGCFSDMMGLIHQIECQDGHPTFLFVGDFVDRGPQVKETLDWCMEHIVPGSRYQSVMGNHEDLMLFWYETSYQYYLRESMHNPSVRYPQTFFDFSDLLNQKQKDDAYVERYIQWIQTLPLYLDVQVGSVTYRIVHGWYDFSLKKELSIRESCLMNRILDGNYQNDMVIVHGHTPTCSDAYTSYQDGDVPGMIFYRKNSINVDGGRVFQPYHVSDCFLCAVCLETLQEYYSPVSMTCQDNTNKWKQQLLRRLGS